MIERLRESKTFYIALSILLAVLFWMYVRTDEDPVKPSTIRNAAVELTGESVLASQGLAVAEISSETVDIEVEAPLSVLSNLNRKTVSALVDVSRCVAGENILYYTPKVSNNVNIDGVIWGNHSPETIVVRVEKLDSKVFPVEFQLRGSVADGYQAGTAAVAPETVTISGPVEQVSKIAKVTAILEVDDLAEQFSGNLPLTLLDTKGEVLDDLDVTMDTKSAYVVLPVVVVKELELTINLISGGGATSEDASFQISPETITVSGSSEVMEGLNELSLGSIDLSTVIGTKVVNMPISLDPMLENISGTSVATVTVVVDDLATRSLEVENIALVGVPAGYEDKITIATKVRSIVIRGKEEDLESIDASQIRIVADMGNEITAVGTYPVPVKVYLDTSSSVGVVGEYSIVVNISR